MTVSTNISAARFYRPELDALRFFAFLMVFAHHVPRPVSVPRLWNSMETLASGVSVFFLLSAYLLTELLMREREQTGSIHVTAFFTRRVLRIWPLYFFAIGVALVLGLLVPAWHLPERAVPYLFLLAGNIYVAKAGWALGLVSPLWSLSVEEQFYLVIPTLMKLGGRQALRFASFACIAAAYVALIRLGMHHAVPRIGVWVNSFVQFQFFAAGTLLALALHKKQWRLSLPLRGVLLLACLALLTITERTFHLQGVAPVGAARLCCGYLLVLAACIGIFLAFLNISLKLPRALTYLGRISYGLYVYHWFVLTAAFGLTAGLGWPLAMHHLLLADLVCLCATILLASASYHLFERRILRLKERFAYIKSGAEGGALLKSAR